MKKLFIAIAVTLALAGCVTTDSLSSITTALTTGVSNPVSKQDLYAFENGMIIAFAGLNAYKKSCANGALPPSCKDTVKQLQVYTRRIPPVLKDLRSFVKNNDQVNARIAYSTATQLLADFKAVATANNVQVQ